MKNQYSYLFLLFALSIVNPVVVYSSTDTCLETTKKSYKPRPVDDYLVKSYRSLGRPDQAERHIKSRQELNSKMLEKEAVKINFNKRLIAATQKKIGNYLVYIAELNNSANSISLFIEIKNNTNTKYLDGSDRLVNSFLYTNSIGGEDVGMFPRWILKDSFGNILKGSAGTPSLAQQLAPHACQKVSGYYQVLPIQGADLIVHFPKQIFGVEGNITIPAKLIEEIF